MYCLGLIAISDLTSNKINLFFCCCAIFINVLTLSDNVVISQYAETVYFNFVICCCLSYNFCELVTAKFANYDYCEFRQYKKVFFHLVLDAETCSHSHGCSFTAIYNR